MQCVRAGAVMVIDYRFRVIKVSSGVVCVIYRDGALIEKTTHKTFAAACKYALEKINVNVRVCLGQ